MVFAMVIIGEIVNRFERAGLKIERMEMGMVTPEQLLRIMQSMKASHSMMFDFLYHFWSCSKDGSFR